MIQVDWGFCRLGSPRGGSGTWHSLKRRCKHKSAHSSVDALPSGTANSAMYVCGSCLQVLMDHCDHHRIAGVWLGTWLAPVGLQKPSSKPRPPATAPVKIQATPQPYFKPQRASHSPARVPASTGIWRIGHYFACTACCPARLPAPALTLRLFLPC